MGQSIYLKDFFNCVVCESDIGNKKKFLCGKKCFRKYRTVYMKYLSRGLSSKSAKLKALQELGEALRK